MQLKTFRANNMADALVEVKNSLGSDAVVLHTRTFRAGGLLGLGGRQVVEITASAPDPVPADAAPIRPSAAPGPAQTYTAKGVVPQPVAAEPQGPLVSHNLDTPKPEQTFEAKPTARNTADLEAELAELKQMMGQVIQSTRGAAAPSRRNGPSALGVLSEPLLHLSDLLIANDLPQAMADELIGAVRDELSAVEREDAQITTHTLLRTLAATIPTKTTAPTLMRGGGRAHTIALLGPTGVGKTTTIAKLAATAKLRHGLRVGLITSDTYRIAAVEQLKTYASIIGVPLQVVTTPDELARAKQALSDCELILVDTAGRSQNDAKRIGELMELVKAAEPDERHLVLSSTNSQQASVRIGERFCVLRPDRLIMTKLDEAIDTGVLAAMPQMLGLPLSYVTSGQEVPDDIDAADADRLARLVLYGPTGEPDPANEPAPPPVVTATLEPKTQTESGALS